MYSSLHSILTLGNHLFITIIRKKDWCRLRNALWATLFREAGCLSVKTVSLTAPSSATEKRPPFQPLWDAEICFNIRFDGYHFQ